MFNFAHPHPGVSPNPVAEMTIKQTVPQTVNADTVLHALPNEHCQEANSRMRSTIAGFIGARRCSKAANMASAACGVCA